MDSFLKWHYMNRYKFFFHIENECPFGMLAERLASVWYNFSTPSTHIVMIVKTTDKSIGAKKVQLDRVKMTI